MNDQKSNLYQYQRLDPNLSPDPTEYPITPPPYTPFADSNSYIPNPTINGINAVPSDSQHIYSQPMPAFTQMPINANPNMFQSNYGTIVQTVPQQTVIFIGSCPACRVGILEEDFTCLGILCCLLFFPLGILCCLALRQRRCPNCGTTFE